MKNFKSLYGKDVEDIKKYIIANKEDFIFYDKILIKFKSKYLASNVLQIKYSNKTVLVISYDGTASVIKFNNDFNLNIEVYFKTVKYINNRVCFDIDSLLYNIEEIPMSIKFIKFMVFSIKNTFITIPKKLVNIKNYNLCLEENLLKYQNIKFYKPSKNIFNSLIYYLDKKMEVTISHNTILLKEYKFVKENTDILIYKEDELIYKTNNNLKDYKIISDLYIDLFYGFYKKYSINIKEISKIFNVTNINNYIIEYFYNSNKNKIRLKPFKIYTNFNNSPKQYINTINFYITDLYFFYEISYKNNNILNIYDNDKQSNGLLYNVLYAEKFDFDIFTDSIDYFLEKSEYLFSYYDR